MKQLFKLFSIVYFVVITSSSGWAQLPPLEPGQRFLVDYTYREQSVNDKVEDTSVFASILKHSLPPPYRPETNSAFPMVTYLLPIDQVVILNSRAEVPDSRLIVQTPRGPHVRFFVHPLSQDVFLRYLKGAEEASQIFKATPLSSFRSVLVWDDQGPRAVSDVMNLKVSLNAEIGQAVRMLSRGQIERATVMSLVLRGADRGAFERQGIHFIDEPFSVYLRDFEFGYTWREIPELKPGVELVPMFSLYAKKGRAKSLLQEIVEKDRRPVRTQVREMIIEPLIRHMFEMADREGVVGEPHEQNVLIGIQDGRLTSQYYYRDLAGFQINPSLRRAAGKDLSFIPSTFKPESLKTERADLISNMRTYLLGSNFYAMRAALMSTSVTKAWVEKVSLEIVREQVRRRTGAEVNSWTAAKAALTKYGNQAQCRSLFR